MDNAGGWIYPANTTGWGTATSTGITITTSGTFGGVYVSPPPPPKKRTPLEWLEDEVERVCAMTRPGLIPA